MRDLNAPTHAILASPPRTGLRPGDPLPFGTGHVHRLAGLGQPATFRGARGFAGALTLTTAARPSDAAGVARVGARRLAGTAAGAASSTGAAAAAVRVDVRLRAAAGSAGLPPATALAGSAAVRLVVRRFGAGASLPADAAIGAPSTGAALAGLA